MIHELKDLFSTRLHRIISSEKILQYRQTRSYTCIVYLPICTSRQSACSKLIERWLRRDIVEFTTTELVISTVPAQKRFVRTTFCRLLKPELCNRQKLIRASQCGLVHLFSRIIAYPLIIQCKYRLLECWEIYKNYLWKTSFTSRYGQYQLIWVPFRLTKGPEQVQRTVVKIIYLWTSQSALVYLDDIVVFPKSIHQHVNHPERFSMILQDVFVERKLIYRTFILRPSALLVSLSNLECLR